VLPPGSTFFCGGGDGVVTSDAPDVLVTYHAQLQTLPHVGGDQGAPWGIRL
jgi:hypothetical protein